MATRIAFTVNGKEAALSVDPGRSLLDVLREDLGLTGAKYGCGEGECGACTVLVDGKPVRSCITTATEVDGKKVVTIEGFAPAGGLHAVQEAFVAEEAMQCGFCTPGMVLEAAALLERKPRPTGREIVEAMDGHICRCCVYPRIVKAVGRAADAGKEKRP
jgi:aerobic-type carbon monoxide dehydrogenase small subunit (CoxS/CutS family)